MCKPFTKSNYGLPQSELLYLKREEGGYLSQYRSACMEFFTDNLEERILELVAASEEEGHRLGKTQFITRYAGKELKPGQKAVGASIDALVEQRHLYLIRDEDSNRAGPKAKLPAGPLQHRV